jgi:inhibitor of KinA sporulation pathway (predicted exonuclease)
MSNLIASLPPIFVLFDTEFTAWEGSLERHWSGPNETCEVVQIGAIRVEHNATTGRLSETDALNVLVRPRINPTLSDYFCRLTGISQAQLDLTGVELADALLAFFDFLDSVPAYSNGPDFDTILDNCAKIGINAPFCRSTFRNIRRPLAEQLGLPCSGLMTSSIPAVFGYPADHLPAHDAVSDCRAILIGLQHLTAGDRPILHHRAILK